ncbi:MAG: SIMPL domain-containing protein [Chloroflexi bacterium]|nr:SIMPL domain-containing protein [Chloroflexota bacterium]
MNGLARAVAIVIGGATFFLVLALLVVVFALVLPKLEAGGAPGVYPPPQNNINVNGEGKVTAEPDLAQIVLGVRTEAEAAGDAVAENNRIMERVRAALTEAGIAEEDIQTVEFSVQPIIIFDELTGEQRTQGYTVTNSVLVKVRHIGQVGEVLDAAATAGANNFGQISFTIADPTPLMDEARDKAIADAQRKAEQMAAATGVRLGDIMYISEWTVFTPVAQPFFGFEGKGGGEFAAEVPISGGQLDIVIQVSITWEIEQ